MKLAHRLDAIHESATLAVTDRAATLRRQGIDIVSLSAGEPDFDTPEHVKEAAVRALRDGFTKYTAVAGISELREAIAARLQRDYGLTYRPADVVVTTGAKQAIFNLLHALCDPGDEVLFFSPYWVSYPEMVRIVGAVPVAVTCSEAHDFRPDLDAFERAITPRARVLLLNTPVNPTGACFTREDVVRIGEIARRHDLWIISDEIYDRLVYDGACHTSMPTVSEDAYRRTLLVNGMSKSYSMTGWRVGYAAGDAAAIAAAVKLQGQSTSNITSISQKAALAALTGDHSFFAGWVAEFDRRRRFLLERLRRIPGIRCATPRGAYYVFANVSALFGKSAGNRPLRNDADLADALLDQAHVAAVPGTAFGSSQHVRFSYATSIENLGIAIDRMERWAATIH